MIKINKPAPPQIIIDNQEQWTKDLNEAITLYGAYDKIPPEEKKSLLVHYRHDDIKQALFASSFNKCAFCECKPGESGNIEVEHFAPKSIYPDLTFDWDNLLPSCRKCNEAKSDFDTITEPIVDPSKTDPEKLFTYNYLRICPINNCPQEQAVKNTIDVYNLNSSRLYDVRAKLIKSLTEYTDELKEKLDSIAKADTPRKQKIRITKLRNSLEKIDQLLEDSSVYAGYCRWFMSQCCEYMQAKRLILENEQINVYY